MVLEAVVVVPPEGQLSVFHDDGGEGFSDGENSERVWVQMVPTPRCHRVFPPSSQKSLSVKQIFKRTDGKLCLDLLWISCLWFSR